MTTTLGSNEKIAMLGIIIGLIVSLIGNIIQLKTSANIRREFKIENFIKIKEILLPKSNINRGDKIAIDYIISNTSGVALRAWLGASIGNSSGKLFYKTSEDKIVNIEKGKQKYTRYLTIDNECLPGIYHLSVQIWRGLVSSPKDSKLIDQYDLDFRIIDY
jgi:hypothetical protein